MPRKLAMNNNYNIVSMIHGNSRVSWLARLEQWELDPGSSGGGQRQSLNSTVVVVAGMGGRGQQAVGSVTSPEGRHFIFYLW